MKSVSSGLSVRIICAAFMVGVVSLALPTYAEPEVISVTMSNPTPTYGEAVDVTIQYCAKVSGGAPRILVAVSSYASRVTAPTGGQVFVVSTAGIDVHTPNPGAAGQDVGVRLSPGGGSGSCTACGESGVTATVTYRIHLPIQDDFPVFDVTDLYLHVGLRDHYFDAGNNWVGLGQCNSGVLSWKVPVRDADFSVHQRVEGILTDPGDLVLFSIDYEYANGKMIIMGELPGGGLLEFVDAGPDQLITGKPDVGVTSGTLTWDRMPDRAGERGQIGATVWFLMRLTSAASAGDLITNVVKGSMDGVGEKTSTTSITVGQPVMSLTKHQSDDLLDPGDEITYTLEYEVSGSALKFYESFDNLTGPYTDASGPPPGWSFLPSRGTSGTWTLKDPYGLGDKYVMGSVVQPGKYPALLANDLNVCEAIVVADFRIEDPRYPGADALLILRNNGEAGAQNSAYAVVFSIDKDPGYVAFQRCTNDVPAWFVGMKTNVPGLTGGIWFRTRTEMTTVGNDFVFKTKVWKRGTPEPSDWTIEWTDVGAAANPIWACAGTNWTVGVGEQGGDAGGGQVVQDSYNSLAVYLPKGSTNAYLIDTIPEGITFLSATGSPSRNNSILRWDLGNVSDQSGSFTWTGRVNECSGSSEFDTLGTRGLMNGDGLVNPIVSNRPELLVRCRESATVGDYVWADTGDGSHYGNGIQDSDEPGLANVTVHLFNADGTELQSKATDADGKYRFGGLSDGTYYIAFDLPTSYAFSPQDVTTQGEGKDSDANGSTGRTAHFDLKEGDNVNTWDAGMYKPQWPNIVSARSYDSDYDQIPNSVFIELNRPFTGENQQKLISVVVTYKGVLDTVPASQVSLDGTSLFVPMRNATEVDYAPTGTVKLIMEVVGTTKYSEADFLDGIGPIVRSAAIKERFGDNVTQDSLYITFSEPVTNPGEVGWIYNLYNGVSVVAGSPTVAHTQVENDERTRWLYVISRSPQVKAGMGLQLRSGAQLSDDAGNTAHVGVHDTVIITLIPAPVPIREAWYVDDDADGVVDRVFVRFFKTISDFSSIDISVRWTADGLTGTPTELSYTSGDSSLVYWSIDGAFPTVPTGRTGGGMDISVLYTLLSHTESGAVADSAAPIILAADYLPGRILDEFVFDPDTLRVRFSENPDVGKIDSNEPLEFRGRDGGSTYGMWLSVDRIEGGNTVRFVVDSLLGIKYPKDNDTVWINDVSRDIVDMNGNVQTVDANKRVPMNVTSKPYLLVISVETPVSPKTNKTPEMITAARGIEGVTITRGVGILVDPKTPLDDVTLEKARAVIYDAVGNTVAELAEIKAAYSKSDYLQITRDPESGGLAIFWNGLNRQGRDVGSGTYLMFLRIEDSNGEARIEKMRIGVQRPNE